MRRPYPEPGWSATIVGVEALRAAGWATQIAFRWDVAIHEGDPAVITEPIIIRRRPPDWFYDVLPGLVRPRGEGEMFRLRPAWALADLLVFERCPERGPAYFGGLTPDDVDPFEVTPGDRADWRDACAAFGLDAEAEARWLLACGSTAILLPRKR